MRRYRSQQKPPSHKRDRRRPLRPDVARVVPSRPAHSRVRQALRTAPVSLQVMISLMCVVALWTLINAAYQVARKPAELFGPISGVLSKRPADTWRAYERVFRKHSTEVITPEFLAALAQVEAAGDPVARPAWQWYATWHPFEVYRPPSSAVGMYQITDGTFAEARRYCIRDHKVVKDGPWHEWDSCWFNSLYSRVVPTHAAEMTAAFLHRRIADILERHEIKEATLEQKQDLAALIHLCGAGAGSAYARRGFRLTQGQRCGSHGARAYLERVNTMKDVFSAYQRKREAIEPAR